MITNKKTSYPIAQRLFTVSGFESMTNKSPRHNFTAAPGLVLFYMITNKN